jgi:hypothetical protein
VRCNDQWLIRSVETRRQATSSRRWPTPTTTPTGTATMHRKTDQRRRQPRDHRIWNAQRNDRAMPDRRLRAWPREHRRRRYGAMDFAGGERVAVDRCGAATAGLSARRRMRRAARRVRAMRLTPSRGHGGFGDHSAWRALSYSAGQRRGTWLHRALARTGGVLTGP